MPRRTPQRLRSVDGIGGVSLSLRWKERGLLMVEDMQGAD